MIPLLPGWQRVVRADAVIMRAMERPVGEVRYREVYGPLRPIRRIVEERLTVAPLPMSTVVKLHAPQRTATMEGEYAATMRLDVLYSEALVRRSAPPPGSVPDRPGLRMFGVTFGDHFTTLIDGLCLEREHFDEFTAAVRGLTQNTFLILGKRRRRFVYQRPPGWQALATPFSTRYIPPDYPGNLAMITVYSAMPAGPSHWFLESVLADVRDRGATVGRVSEQENFAVAGLDGHRWRITSESGSQTRNIMAIVLQDKHYVYRLRFDHGGEHSASQPIFDAVCASIERIPDPVTAKLSGLALDHWIE